MDPGDIGMSRIILRAVGDNLMHKPVYTSGLREDGSCCYDREFEHVQPLIDEADISVINQETIFVKDREKISYFPFFGSPVEAGDAIRKAGFTVVTHASNHALDKGYAAIKHTVGYWEKADSCIYTGVHTEKKDADRIRVIEKNGIRVAVLNYTGPLNYHIVPPLHPHCVDVMKPYSKGRIARQIRQAKSMADVVAVFPHWGCEYLYEPVPAQKEWARFFADAGADIIIGTHPHVLQYREIIVSQDGREVPCFYSLGNFRANQGQSLDTKKGAEAKVIISYTWDAVTIKGYELKEIDAFWR